MEKQEEKDLTANDMLNLSNKIKENFDKYGFVRLESMAQIGKSVTNNDFLELIKSSIILYFDESDFKLMQQLGNIDIMIADVKKLPEIQQPKALYYILPENKLLYDEIKKTFDNLIKETEKENMYAKNRYHQINMTKFIKDEKALNELLEKYGIKHIDKLEDFKIYDITIIDEETNLPKITTDHNVIIVMDNHKFNETYLIDMVLNLLMCGFEFEKNTEIVYVTDFKTRLQISSPKHEEVISECNTEELMCDFERTKMTPRILMVRPKYGDILSLTENYLEPINFGSIINAFVCSDLLSVIPDDFSDFIPVDKKA